MAGEFEPAAALARALALHAEGDLNAAAALYSQVLAQVPEQLDARHYLGVIAHQQGEHTRAARLIQEVIAQSPGNAAAWANLGLVHKALGQVDRAQRGFEEAIRLAPQNADAHYNLGLLHLAAHQLEASAQCFERALKLQPEHAQAWQRLGNIWHQRAAGQTDGSSGPAPIERAVGCYTRAHALAPGDTALMNALGRALLEQGDRAGALVWFDRALALSPEELDSLLNKSRALRQLHQFDQALALARQAHRLAPDDGEVWRSLGMSLKLSGQIEAAARAFGKALIRRRASALAPTAPADSCAKAASDERFGTALSAHAVAKPSSLFTFTRTTRAKLVHDLAQIDYLSAHNLGGKWARTAREDIAGVLQQVPSDLAGGQPFAIPPKWLPRMARHYNRLNHLEPAPALAGGAVNPALDRDAIEREYFAREPGLGWFDELLRPQALRALREYCLRSCIWYDFHHANGYLGAYLEEGFHCPLLLQIAAELRAALPGIFKQHPLTQLWAYKYDNQSPEGIEMHADFAAVNVNFWLTKDSACMDPSRGGLLVWDREAPSDWGFAEYNSASDSAQARIAQFLRSSGAQRHRVPYRENRVVLFNSDLFHRTDTVHFADGYENRRINVTMLFGHREADPQKGASKQ